MSSDVYGPTAMNDLLETACCADSKPEEQIGAWKRKGDRAMTKGKFTICEYGFKPNVDYGLFGAGPEMLAHDTDFRVLMAKAEEML